jgi:hypothetical protein
MRILASLLLVALGAAGCGDGSNCKEGTLSLGLELDTGTDVADSVTIVITVDGKAMTSVQPHAPGQTFSNVEIDFPAGYPADKTVSLDLTASLTGTVIGIGHELIHLLPGCTDGLAHVYPPFITPDAGATD